ncbi:MAG: sugar fermentation stimulation protein [Peptococcaceae bacterium BICA1-7]|nr:MAG: sugar fermentation stimulation protein [Peptococcaceae bacterium BICA1-7]
MDLKADIEAKIVLPRLSEAVFLCRRNRFVGEVEFGGGRELAHVPSSGRMTELLYPGAPVYIAPASSPGAKLRYRILMAENSGHKVSVDSLLPNRLVYRALAEGVLPELEGYTRIRREAAYGQGRFDFFLEGAGAGCYLEVKSVTLVRDGVALFPDAPSERGARHMEELALAKREGFRAVVLFVIQRQDACSFSPNSAGDPHFGRQLSRAALAGVEVLARLCLVDLEKVALGGPVPVML